MDRARAERNIARMAAKAAASGVRFRPHFKTHNSPEVGSWFGEPATTPITVSSVAYARLFADAGWRDITIAFPLNIRALAEVGSLAAEVRLGVLLDNEVTAAALDGRGGPGRRVARRGRRVRAVRHRLGRRRAARRGRAGRQPHWAATACAA